ncbi:hypothetical protein PVAP13_1NG402719, partial [Panicum virgatum]
DSGIWNPDNAPDALEEEDLDCRQPEEYDQATYVDDDARVFHERDVQYKTCRDPDVVPLNNSSYDAVYKDLPTRHFVLCKVPICEYCGAKRFPGEGPGFCCRQEKVNIFTVSISDELRRLFTSQNDMDAQYFRNNI